MSKGIVAPKNKLGVKKGYNNNNKGELCVDLQNMQYYWDVWKPQQKYQNYKVSIIFTKMFHFIHIISGSFDISDSESDQSGKATESRNENESEPEETNPLMRLHVMSEKSNWKNESHGQEEIKDEEEKSSKLIHWISLLLLRINISVVCTLTDHRKCWLVFPLETWIFQDDINKYFILVHTTENWCQFHNYK